MIKNNSISLTLTFDKKANDFPFDQFQMLQMWKVWKYFYVCVIFFGKLSKFPTLCLYCLKSFKV